ncbi:MAG: HU family DNA-binding protein [Myxococcota bacterium]
MTKSDLINAVHAAAADADIEMTKKATGELIDIVFDQVASAIDSEKRFAYPNFGTFTVKHRKEREGRNPRTKKPITIPASNTVNFKPAPTLRDSIN